MTEQTNDGRQAPFHEEPESIAQRALCNAGAAVDMGQKSLAETWALLSIAASLRQIAEQSKPRTFEIQHCDCSIAGAEALAAEELAAELNARSAD